jgi:hypothetical protein
MTESGMTRNKRRRSWYGSERKSMGTMEEPLQRIQMRAHPFREDSNPMAIWSYRFWCVRSVWTLSFRFVRTSFECCTYDCSELTVPLVRCVSREFKGRGWDYLPVYFLSVARSADRLRCPPPNQSCDGGETLKTNCWGHVGSSWMM